MNKQQYPEPTVGALILNSKGGIFLMKSFKWRNNYVIPGGHIELGEKIIEALKREIKEETGLNIYDIKFLCLQEFIYDKAFWKKRHFLFLNYTCKTKSNTVKLNSEGQGYIWVKPKESLNLPIEPYTKTTIREYLKRRQKKA